MASSITAQSVLEEISQDHLQCPICSERFKQPKLLECSHSFCLECLQQLRQESPRASRISCPECNEETLLNANGIDDLKTNFTALSLMEDIEKQEAQLKQQQRKHLPSQEFVSECRKHQGKDLNKFCNKCMKVVCTTCIVRDHQSHSSMEINEASDKCKQHAEELLAEVRQSIKTFNIAIQEIDTSRKTLDSMFAATKEKISKRADEETAKENARIREEKQKLMKEAEQIYKQRVKAMKTARAPNSTEMNKAEHKHDEVIQLIDQRIEIVHHMKQILQDLNKYRMMRSTNVPDGLTYMDFKEGKKSLGRLVLKDEAEDQTFQPMEHLNQYKWTLTSNMHTYKINKQQTVEIHPWYVAVYSNSDITVLDWISHSLFKISAESNPQPTAIPQELSIKGLIEASRFTVSKNDELIVLDDETIKIFKKNYELLHEFDPSSKPSCIAVYDDNLIALGYSNKEEISLHKTDGSLVTTLPAPGIGDYLTTSQQRLIYTNWNDRKLVSLDYNGKEVFSVFINQSGSPRAVCCDKDGFIYISVCKSVSSLGDILQYSPDGKYSECIIKDYEYPSGITVTPAGDLVVASDKSVQIYHHE